MIAPMVLDGPINGDWFEAYVGQVLIPELRPGDVVIMDNLSCHKRADLARFKAMLCKAGERTAFALGSLIGKLRNLFRPQECAN